MKKILLSLVILFFISTSFSQNVGIGTVTPNASAKLEVTSNNSGFLLPRLTTAQRDAIPSPAIGLIIFNSSTNTLEIFTGSWGSVTFSSPQVKKLFGSAGYDEAYDVKQTTDGGFIIAGMAAIQSGNPGTFAGLVVQGMQDGLVIKTDANGNVQWQKLFGGTLHDYFENVSQTSDGGYILGGRAASSNTGTFAGVTGNGSSDGWIVKLDASGNLQWQKLLGGSASETLYSIAQTADGYIVGGSSSSSNTGTLTGLFTNGGTSDGWIIKLDATGTVQWQKLLGGTLAEIIYNVVKTADGGYIAAGYSSSANTGTLVGTSSNGGNDFWILKLTTTGTTQWQKLFGGPSSEYANDIIQTTDGGYIVAGAASSTNAGTLTGLDNNGASDGWILKLDDFGNVQWQRLFGGASGDAFQSIQQTVDGGYILSGNSQSSNNGTLTGLTGNGSNDGWIVKIDNVGGLQWQKLYGGYGDDLFTGVRQTTDGGYVVAATTSATNSGYLVGYNNNGNSDVLLLKLDKSGNQ